jgi:uncharacterized protein
MTRTFTSIVVVVALVYAMLCLVTYLRQRQMIFFPTSESTAVDLQPMWIDTGQERLKVWPLRSDRTDALIYFGGNAEDVMYSRELFDAVAPEYAVYLVNYRGYGGSSGSPSEQGFNHDALHVFDSVASSHRAVGLVGRSLGSAVATHVAARRPASRLILVTPMDSIESLARRHYPWLPVSLLMKDPFRSIDNAPRITTPTLVVMSEHDRIVPAESTQKLIEAFTEAPLTVMTLDGHDHNSFGGADGYGSAIQAFLAHKETETTPQ